MNRPKWPPRWLPALALAGAYLACRVVILLGGKVFTSYDTFSYAYRGDPFFDRGPLVSFVGNAPRLWGIPLFYAAFPSDQSRAVAQWAIGTIAWALLAWSAAMMVRSTAARLVAATGILLVGLIRPVSNWDFAILSESLSLSLGALVLAFFFWWYRTRALLVLIAMGLTSVWWTFTRPDIRILTGTLMMALAVIAWRARAHGKPFRWQAAGAALAIGLSLVWCTVAAGRVEQHHQRYASLALNQKQELFVYQIRLVIMADPAIKATFQSELGLPSCPAAEEIAAGSEWATLEFKDAYFACPELVQWGLANQDRMWQRFAVAAPDQFLRTMWDLTNQSFAGATYAQTPSVLPPIVERAAFPTRRHGLPFVLLIIAATIAACAFAGGFRRDLRPLAVTGLVIAAASLAGGAAGALLGAGEYWRFGLQEAIAIRLAAVFLAVAAVDALMRKREQPANVARSAPDDIEDAHAR